MRITNKMMVTNFKTRLTQNMASLDGHYKKLSSGKNISLPSDNPVSTSRVMSVKNSRERLEQYLKNIDDGLDWMNATESAFARASNLMENVRDLTVQGANDTLSDADKEIIMYSVDQYIQELISIANSSEGERYIFGGQRTTEKPFDDNGDYHGSSTKRTMNIELGQVVTVGITGAEAFKGVGDSSGVDIFETLKDISNWLKTGDTDSLSGVALDELDKCQEQILRVRAENGAQFQQLEASRNRIEDMIYHMKLLLSKIEEVDYAEVITESKMQENVYIASLAVGARIIQPSLVDYLV